MFLWSVRLIFNGDRGVVHHRCVGGCSLGVAVAIFFYFFAAWMLEVPTSTYVAR